MFGNISRKLERDDSEGYFFYGISWFLTSYCSSILLSWVVFLSFWVIGDIFLEVCRNWCYYNQPKFFSNVSSSRIPMKRETKSLYTYMMHIYILSLNEFVEQERLKAVEEHKKNLAEYRAFLASCDFIKVFLLYFFQITHCISLIR